MEFSRPEYWSGSPFPFPGDLPNPGIKPRSPALQADSLPAEPQGREATREAHITLEEARIVKDTCTPIFTAAQFTIARTWKQPRCSSADKWIRKLWYIYT